MSQFLLGVGTVAAKGTISKFGSRTVALITALSSMSRFSKSTKNEAFFLVIGPLTLPLKFRDMYGARVGANGLREFSAWLLKLNDICPRNRSVPGLVSISILPDPGRSYSAEKGFALILTSRIEDRGGNRPPLKPSM